MKRKTRYRRDCRRGGKSTGAVVRTAKKSRENPGRKTLYINLTAANAYLQFVEPLLELLKKKRIPHRYDGQLMIVTLANGSMVMAVGCDDIADVRRKLGEARAEVADLLPRLDAAALENTQLGRERDGARNEPAEAIKNKDTLIIENNTLLCRAEDAESECDDLRAWKEGAMAVMAEWDGLRKLVEDGSPAQLGRGLAENTERVIRDLRAKVDELESGARVARLVEANRQLKAKVERRTGLVEQALEGRRSNWKLSQWFDWEHMALAELATDAQ